MTDNTTGADKEAPKSDRMTVEDAQKTRLLLLEDIRKYEQNIAQLEARIAAQRVYIAEIRTMLADVDRREAGVEYPPPPQAPEAKMGEPVGGPETASK